MKKHILIIFILSIILCVNAQDKKSIETIEIQTNGVCEKCKDRMMENIPFEKGVTDCNYDLATSKLTVSYNPSKTNPDNIRLAISKLGYDADQVKADASAREKLPACCKAPKGSSECHHEHANCQHKHESATCPHEHANCQHKHEGATCPHEHANCQHKHEGVCPRHQNLVQPQNGGTLNTQQK